MNKTDLVDRISDKTGNSKKAVGDVIDTMFDEISSAVASGGDKVTIQGYLSFEKVKTAARKGHNPQTGESMQIPAGTRTKVTVLSKLKASGK